jgi:hypothetical protein
MTYAAKEQNILWLVALGNVTCPFLIILTISIPAKVSLMQIQNS